MTSFGECETTTFGVVVGQIQLPTDHEAGPISTAATRRIVVATAADVGNMGYCSGLWF